MESIVKHERLIVNSFLGAVTAYMLYMSWLFPFGDEQYFYQIALKPFNTSHPLWFYSPVPPLLMSPIAHLTDSPFLLRLPTIVMSITSLYLIYQITKRKTSPIIALTFILPVLFTARLLVGAIWFYWDTYAMLFFVLTLYLLNSKRAYITGSLLALSKLLLGPILLLTLIPKQPKLALLGLLYLPIFLTKPTYLLSIAQSLPDLHQNTLQWISILTPDLMLYLLVTLPSLLLVRKHPTEVLFYIATLLYSLVSGLGVSHTSTIIYSGALVTPIAIQYYIGKEVNLIVKRPTAQSG